LEHAFGIIEKIESVSSFNLTLSYSNRIINWNLDDEMLEEEFRKYRANQPQIILLGILMGISKQLKT
jgi:hypothetical protein